jgi:hypothetical protein
MIQKEEFEDTKGVIRSRKSKKDRQYKINVNYCLYLKHFQALFNPEISTLYSVLVIVK